MAGHDIGAVYRALRDVGVSQRRIAALTGQSQPEVSEMERGRLDAAEPFAAASVRLWEGRSGRRGRTVAGILLATIHVRAGESDGLRLADEAITDTMRLSSVRTRRRLEPLAAALEARPGSDHRELARDARQVATTRV